MKRLLLIILMAILISQISSNVFANGNVVICKESHMGSAVSGQHTHDKYGNIIPCNKNTGIPFKISVVVNGEQIKFDTEPIIVNSRTMVPIAKIVEKLNCQVNWDNSTRTVYINEEFYDIEKTAVPSSISPLDINVYVNNKKVSFPDQKPTILNGRTLVPVKMVAEQLNCLVSWDAKLQTVYIEQISYY